MTRIVLTLAVLLCTGPVWALRVRAESPLCVTKKSAILAVSQGALIHGRALVKEHYRVGLQDLIDRGLIVIAEPGVELRVSMIPELANHGIVIVLRPASSDTRYAYLDDLRCPKPLTSHEDTRSQPAD